MFRGDSRELGRVLAQGWALARHLGHPRVGSEHLLLALTAAGGEVAATLARRGATTASIREAVCRAAPAGAGAAADRDTLAPLGIDLDRLLGAGGAAALDRPPSREPLLPLGAAEARRRCARFEPPIGLDAQAAYAASLQLALARWDRDHRPEHLLLVLLAVDPGARWALHAAGVPTEALLGDLAAAFPPPRRTLLLRAERRLNQRSRSRRLVRCYQHTTGRTTPADPAVTTLIAG